jgi:hypothetical protein
VAHHPTCCSKCGFRVTPSTARPRRRALIRVVDELGSSQLCDVCVLILIADLGSSGDVTVFVGRPNVTASQTPTDRKDTR